MDHFSTIVPIIIFVVLIAVSIFIIVLNRRLNEKAPEERVKATFICRRQSTDLDVNFVANNTYFF